MNDTYVEPVEAYSLLIKLIRRWRAILLTSRLKRPSARKFLVMNERLRQIREAVTDHYDLPKPYPNMTSISTLSFEAQAMCELGRLLEFAARLVDDTDELRLLPQDDIRRVFMGSGASAGSFMNAPMHAVIDDL